MDMTPFDTSATISASDAMLPEAAAPAPGASAPRWLRPALLDRAEQIVIVSLWVWFVVRLVRAYHVHYEAVVLLPLISETTVMAFTLIRRPTQAITLNLGDWLLAVTATAAPLLLITDARTLPALQVVSVGLIMLGNIGQALAKLSLRRSFGVAPANRGVKINGAYRFVRHPMYAGYLLVHIGTILVFPLWINALIYGVGWAAQIKRLLAEERLLGQDPAYAAYMSKVRWRLLPGVF